MTPELVAVTRENICSFAGLYTSVFNNPPWNDGWSETAVHERFESFAQVPKFRGLGCHTDGKPSALVFGWGERWVKGWHFHIKEMCVAASLQRQKTGTWLLAAFERELVAAGYQGAFLETSQSAPARDFYEKLGYNNLSHVSLAKRLRDA